MPTNQYGISELVDTAADILETAKTLADAISDGFQITDVTALFAIAPKAVEIKNDWKTAVSELLDLTPDEAAEAARLIAVRTGLPQGGIIARVNEGFTLAARTYGKVKETQYLIEDWGRWGRSLYKKPAA